MSKDNAKKRNNRSNRRANRTKSDYNDRGREREVEENIDYASLNKSDLPNSGNKSTSRRGKRSSDNDVAWYSNNPELLNAAANFPWGQPIGVRLRALTPQPTVNNGKDVEITPITSSIPGILIINYVPTIGGTEDGAVAPINMASMKQFAFQRSRNSRSASYDAPNLTMYFLAMRSLYALYADLVRVYGAISTSSPFSRYMPKSLCEAMGYDYEDLSANMAQFNYLINQFAYKLGQVNVPAGMSVIDRNVWMNSNVFMDSNTPKAQMYLFHQEGYHRYTEAVQGPSYLQYKPVNTYLDANATLLTVSNISTMMTDLLQPVLESEDLGTISADVMKAYGLENCITVSPIVPNYFIQPTYSAEVLSQIENTTLCGSISTNDEGTPSTLENLNIYEIVPANELGSPYLSQNVYTNAVNTAAKDFCNVMASTLSKPFIVNMHTTEVSPGSTIVATRLTNIASLVLGRDTQAAITKMNWGVCGTEIATTMQYVTFAETALGWQSVKSSPLDSFIYSYSTSWGKTMLQVGIINVFDWCPRYYLSARDGQDNTLAEMCDFDYFTTIDLENLKQMHAAAVISEFEIKKIESMGKRPQ